MKKIAIVAYTDEIGTFIDALQSGLEKRKNGDDVKLIIEGNATHYLKDISKSNENYKKIFETARKNGLIDCVCETCSKKTNTIDYAKNQGLHLSGESYGHPSLFNYSRVGYEIIYF